MSHVAKIVLSLALLFIPLVAYAHEPAPVTPPNQTAPIPMNDSGCPSRCYMRVQGCNGACGYSKTPGCYSQCQEEYSACLRSCS
jgi:hypothetical protein